MCLASQYKSEGNEGLVLSFSLVRVCFARGKGMCLSIQRIRNRYWQLFVVPV